MLPNINPREMQKAIKRLGIKQEEVDAEVVIIKTPDKDLIINDPKVSKIDMMGQKTFQIIGDVTEVEREESKSTEDDIATVMEQTSCTREDALEALEQSNGNLAEAILKLQNK